MVLITQLLLQVVGWFVFIEQILRLTQIEKNFVILV